ncbi:MAG: 50S ribosomal protein L25 [Christensenellales bacterium]|jgi:large subunit ribosomal protein L25
MFILKAENRDAKLKPKQLRRKGIIPGVLYGKNLEESVSIQIPHGEAMQFLRSNSIGSTVEINIGDKKSPALLREISYKTASYEPEHLSFQTLVAGETITSTARVILLNREKVSGTVQQTLTDISYQALTSDLFDRVEIDLDGVMAGSVIRVSDLEVAKNPDIEILTPHDSVIISVVDIHQMPDLDEDGAEADADTEAAPEAEAATEE